MQEKPKVTLYLDTRRSLANDKYPVKIRITWQIYKHGKPTYLVKYFSTNHSVTEKEYVKIEKGTSQGDRLVEIQEDIYKARAKASAIIEDNKRISIEQFKARYAGVYSTGTNIGPLFDELIEEKLQANRIGSYRLYTVARDHFLEYAQGDIQLNMIDLEWLRAYTQKMKEKGKSVNTYGLYLKVLSLVFNRAIDKRLINRDIYPFGKNGYQIQEKKSKKKALPVAIKDKLVAFTPENDQEAECIDFLLLSYYANGMNFRDIAHLKPSNFKGDTFSFVRRKTMHTVNEQKEIQIYINPAIEKILQRRGGHEPYVFGIIDDTMTALEQYRVISLWITDTNKVLSEIATKVGYQEKLTTYSARHTFTSILLNAGVPITKIKDALGHESVLTTQRYAEDLDIEDMKKYSELL